MVCEKCLLFSSRPTIAGARQSPGLSLGSTGTRKHLQWAGVIEQHASHRADPGECCLAAGGCGARSIGAREVRRYPRDSWRVNSEPVRECTRRVAPAAGKPMRGQAGEPACSLVLAACGGRHCGLVGRRRAAPAVGLRWPAVRSAPRRGRSQAMTARAGCAPRSTAFPPPAYLSMLLYTSCNNASIQ